MRERHGRLVESAAIDLASLSRAMDAQRLVGSGSVEVSALAYDSRDVRPGTLFFCVRGFTSDGHDFAAAAAERGAAALVVERELDAATVRGIPQAVVANARAAMAPAADLFYGSPTSDLTVAAVTGTNGKTTTAFLLYAILAAAGRRPGLVGTVEWRIGGERRAAVHTTPEAIDLQATFREMLDAGDRSCALEASSHASALHRLDRVRFSALVFTNLSQDHLDFHGSMEAYYEAKRVLFLTRGPDGRLPPAAVNIGDAYGRRLAAELRRAGGELLTFGLEPDADVHPASLELTAAGASFAAAGIEVTTRLRGRFNVENVLGAVAAARLLELADDAIGVGVGHLRGVPGRLEPVEEGQPFTVLIDYAHSPDALERVLEAAREISRGRVICVFGCGGDRDRAKRPLMGEVVRRLADELVVTSDNPRSEDPTAIIDEILAGTGQGPGVSVEPDRRRAIGAAVGTATDGDVVVIAGKGHEQGQTFADRTVPFSDVDEARDALRRLASGTHA
jgi:UDP-N-acetylmuramoyl-L-alanyl-D-glutamate--2,6-diaminopimelate ligase